MLTAFVEAMVVDGRTGGEYDERTKGPGRGTRRLPEDWAATSLEAPGSILARERP
jgi:hypothetical protein